MFVAVLERLALVLATADMHNVPFLCNEFDFADLLSQVTEFIAAHSAGDCQA
jgi:hypothetical protein